MLSLKAVSFATIERLILRNSLCFQIVSAARAKVFCVNISYTGKGGWVPRPVNSQIQKCCATCEWPELPLRRNTRIYAGAEKFALRARATRNCNGCLGLGPDFRRKCHERPLWTKTPGHDVRDKYGGFWQGLRTRRMAMLFFTNKFSRLSVAVQ